MRSPSRLALVALPVLTAFLAVWAESALVHEDDGCAVERHCLSCRWSVGTTAVLGGIAALPVAQRSAERPVLDVRRPLPTPVSEAAASRGPPLA